MTNLFHLAFPVHDLDAAREFYSGILECEEGRSSECWIEFSAQALKGGADQVRAEFDRARVQAIRSGKVYSFLYQQDGDSYAIAPLVNAYSLVKPSVVAAMGDAPALKKLPSGLLFAGSSVSDDARAQFESEQGQVGENGMTPILFYPDGTSQDAYLYLQNMQGEHIRIYLRGLTGMSSASRQSDEGAKR
jgi:catechol 2,3-dioxygenase-like lactoylglutathione lyase family enzyme